MDTCVGVVLMLAVSGAAAAGKWSYTGNSGPAHWHTLFPEACSGRQQSPIDIRAEQSLYDERLRDFALWYDPPKPDSKMYIKNNGHTVQVDTEGEFFVSNGGLQHVYRAAQFHFHWGRHGKVGSEHTLEGRAAPIEMHLVTWNQDVYGDIGQAVTERGGLAVLGVLFQVSKEDNPALENIVKAMKHIKDPEGRVRIEIPVVPLGDLLPKDTSRYYRYNGSLTTPGCFESVTWTVFDEMMPISHRQLREFRSLLQLRQRKHRNHHSHHGHQGAQHRRRRAAEEKEAMAELAAVELGVKGDVEKEALLKAELVEIRIESGVDDMTAEAQSVPPKPAPTTAKPVEYIQEVLVDNFRPVQPLHGRLVYRSFKLRAPPVWAEAEGAQPDVIYQRRADQPAYAAAPTRGNAAHGVRAGWASALVVLISAFVLKLKL